MNREPALRATCVGFLVALGTGAPVAHAGAPRVTEDRLGNGLHVILAPDPSVSSVAIHVRFATTADDEPLARVVERLLFAGSHDAQIDAAGGWTTSVTTADHVGVVDQVPAEAFELALWLEAKRMAGLADPIDSAQLARVIAAIDGARREAEPYTAVARAVDQALWAAGSAVDPTTFAALVHDRFGPATATLVIAGRFDRDRARKLVRDYFGAVPRRGRLGRVTQAPPSVRAVELAVADPIPKVVVAARTAPGPAVEVAARVIEKRLVRALVHGGLATEAHVELDRRELRVSATAQDGVAPARLAAEIDAELARLRDEPPPTDEVTRATIAIEADLAFALEGLAFRAETLAGWAAYGTGDLAAVRADLRAVTPEAARRAARSWLGAQVTVIGR